MSVQYISSRKEGTKNIYEMYSYLRDESNTDRQSFVKRQYEKASCFVVAPFGELMLFAPAHIVVQKLLDNLCPYSQDAEQEAINYLCTTENLYHKIDETNSSNEELDKISDKFQDFFNKYKLSVNQDISFLCSCELSSKELLRDSFNYIYICPTHVSTSKNEAWESFKNKGIIAIGITDEDCTQKSLDEIKELLKPYTETKKINSYISAFNIFKSLKEGDIVACRYDRKYLYGLGVALSSYKYQYHIHDPGVDSEGGHYLYSHYVDVAWVLPDITLDNLKK